MADKVQKDFDADAFKKELGLDGKFVITYVGAHGVANHLIQLIDVAEKLQNTNIIFQLIGSGMRKEFLQKEVSIRNLKNVIFRNSVPKSEVFKFILASNVGTSVLKNIDTFKTIYSNKTFDYMSCKIPILMIIDGVSRQLIEESRAGIYVEPENTKSIVEGINILTSMNKNELQIMGNAGYEYSKKYFDRVSLAKTYIKKLQTFNNIS